MKKNFILIIMGLFFFMNYNSKEIINIKFFNGKKQINNNIIKNIVNINVIRINDGIFEETIQEPEMEGASIYSIGQGYSWNDLIKKYQLNSYTYENIMEAIDELMNLYGAILEKNLFNNNNAINNNFNNYDYFKTQINLYKKNKDSLKKLSRDELYIFYIHCCLLIFPVDRL